MQCLIDSDFVEVEGQPGYFITSDGKLYSNHAAKFLSGYVGKNGYLYYTFKDKTRQYAHRLVALHFIPRVWWKPQVNHKDFNRLNNHVNNLEWVTASENTEHAYTKQSRKKVDSYKHPNTKLTDSDIINIFLEDGALRQIAAKYGTSDRTVLNIKKGVRHGRVTERITRHDRTK